MDRRLNVSLGFNADTRAAKQQIQSLQDQLTALVNSPVGLGEKLTADLVKASHAAAELKVHLKNATNVETGALDFSKLNQSITKSGQSLSSYASQLQKLGPQGQQAFMSLANAVASAEVPLKRSNVLLNNFMTTLKNTAKWQLSSSLLHGLQSGVQEAYGYAQDLNESLNNIRIVTGQNIDQMAKFAKEANNAAKALSTTTTEYTNASLIYYQQGLSPQEVKERTDLTIKMANVARVSAEAASDQLTAVWNNFADGTKSLEYYVDVMTALGAKTASSTDEIAGGLEKFAGIATTIGLSYEYATSALATLTSNTRQSEEVVGTALKTIFARIQGLNLGETLEDGVTLNKYSQAMKTVGIDILDQQKNLKSMDTLLDELGNKWNTISKAQQTALAQTVAGTRQYTQLVSLMDNWNKGDEDSFLANLATARGSSGALQEQADIYAESWEAARDRVTAAAEKIYAALFNDEDFIKITNLFADMIDLVGDFTSSIGGLEGVLSGLGLIMTKVFSEQMAQGFRNIAYNVQMSTEAGRKAVQQQKVKVMDEFATMMANNEASDIGSITAKQAYSQELQLQTELIANADKMTAAEREKCQYLLEQQRAYGQQTIEMAKQLEILQHQKDEQVVDIYGEALSGGMRQDSVTKRLFGTQDNRSSSLTGISTIIGNTATEIQKLGSATDFTEDQMNSLKMAFQDIGDSKVRDKLNGMVNALGGMKAGSEEAQQQLLKLQGVLDSVANKKVQDFLDHSGLEKGTTEYNNLSKALNSYIEYNKQAIIQETKLAQSQDKLNTSFVSVEEAIKTAKDVTKDWANHLSTMTSSLMSLGMLMSSISGLMDTLEDPNTSGWEKFGSVLTSVSMIAMSLGGVFQGLSAAQALFKGLTDKNTLATLANAAATIIQSKAKDQSQKETSESAVATKIETEAIKENSREKIVNSVINKESGTEQNISASDEILPLKDSLHIIQQAFVQLLPTIGAVAGIIAITTLTITAASVQWQRFEKDLEKANVAAEHVADSYNEVRTSYDEFSNSTKSYNDIVKSMEDLTEGTLEYNDALIKANEQALQLIENNKELAGKYFIDKGLITFDKGALETLQQSKLQNVAQSQAASLQSNISISEAQRALDRNNLSRDIDSFNDAGYKAANQAVLIGGAVVSGLLATLLPGLGPVIAAGIISALGATGTGINLFGDTASKAENEALIEIAQYVRADKGGNNIFASDPIFRDHLNELAKNNKIEQSLVNSLVKHRTAIEKWVSVENAAIAKEKQDWYTAFAAYNMSNASYNEAASQNYINTESEKLITDDVKSSLLEEVQSLSNKELAETYRQEVLKDTEGKYRITNLAGGNVTLEKAVEGGGWEKQGDKNSLSKEEMEKAIANMRAMAYTSEQMPEIIDQYSYSAAALSKAGLDAEEDAALIQKILEQYSRDGAIDFANADLVDIDKIIVTNLENGLASAIEKARDRLKEGLNQDVLTSDWYKGLTEENKEFLWSNIEIDKNDAVEEVQAAYEAMQAFLTNNQLTTTIEVSDTLISSLKKEGKSKTDWDNLKTYYTETFLSEYSDAMSWDKFMELSQQEQIDYVEAVRSGAIQGSAITNPGAVEKQKKVVDALIEQDEKTQLGAKQYDENKQLLEAAQKAYNNKKYRSILGKTNNEILTETFGNSAWSYYSADSVIDFLTSDLALPEEYSNLFEAFAEAQSVGDWDEAHKIIDALLANLGITNTDKGNQISTALYSMMNGQSVDAGYLHTIIDQLQTVYNTNIDLSQEVADIQRYGESLIGGRPNERETNEDVKRAQDDLNTLRQNYQNALDAQEKLFTEMGLGLDDVNNLANVLSSINKELENNEYLANAIAASMLRYSKGITEVAKNYENWLAILESGEELQKSALTTELRQVYGDLLNINGESLTYNFLADEATLELANRATTDTKAYNDLQLAAAMSMGATGINTKNLYKLASDESKVGTSFTWEQNNEDAFGTQLAYLYTRSYAKAINELEMTDTEAKDLANNIIRALGFELLEGTFDNGKFTGVTTFGKTAEDSGGVLDPEALKKQKKNELDEIERYKTINDQLDELADKYSDATKQAERLYGQARLNEMSKANQILQNEIYLLEEKKRVEAEAYKTTDRQAVNDALAKMGVGTFDYEEDTGIITNYRSVMEAAKAKAEGTGADDPLRESYQELLDAIEQYDQTRELLRDLENQVTDKRNQIQDTNYQKLTDKLNYGLDTTEAVLQDINFSLSLIEDNAYKAAEALSLMIGGIEKDGTWSEGGQLKAYQDMLSAYATGDDKITGGYVAELIAAREDGKISDDAFVEGMKESRDAIYSNLEALIGLDKQMLEYYGNTLAAAGEEIGKYTDRIEHLTSVLDHYSAIMKLIGKEKNYEMMGEILKGSAQTLKNTLDVSKAEYEFYKNEEQTKRELYEANKGTPAGELFKKEWEAAEAAMRESQNRMLEDTKAWAEAEKAVIENAMEAAAASLERSLTGGDTFDFLTTRLDHAVSIQEEYLTTTNKIYETTKLMRTAQQAVDAATNATTKQKLKNFITETQQLQDQTDLSKYELEIQQAKYDLLLAEIALQDAQNAKSMVRLKRDSEGNFGYVYTADDNQVADAQQNLEDAENNLYNIALRGAEDYTTKSIEIRQEMWEKLQELDKQHRDGAFVNEEEYQRARDELIAYYTHKIEDYSKFYGIAIETDNRVVTDSWSTTFADILKSTENWNTKVSNYLGESETNFTKWQGIVDQVATDTGLDMQTLASTVKGVTDESDALKKSLAGDGKEDKGLIGTLENVLKEVSDLTLKYAPHRSEVEKLVEKYQAWAGEIQAVIDNMTTLNNFDLEDPNGLPPPKVGTEEGAEGDNETNISGSSPAINTGITSSTFNPMDHIGRTVSVINLGGVAMSKASKQALGIDGWLKISGITKNNGNTLFEVTNDAGEVVGSFLKEDLFPINQFASGGYTGEWGPSGKLAMLHEKELILNQMDTFNMLTAVDTLHKILEIIDLQSLNASLGGMLSVPGYRDTGSGMLEQNVKIEATFPNVSDHFEIEEAFNTLINQASQYANRK